MDKTVIQTTDISKPPFSPRPIPPTSETLAAPQAGGAHQNGTIDPTSTGDAQPVLGASTNLPLSAIDSLPIIAGQSRKIIRPEDEIPDFLDFELDLSRLNRIHDQLWMAGRPMRARPLHRYKMMGMEVLQTQQMDLHLLKFSTKLLVKPLPEWMVCHNFWTEWLCKDGDEDDKSKDDGLWKSAAGFLVSYVWLVTTPLDLKIAHDCFLLPSFITWHWWKDFARDFMDHVDMETLQQVNQRYQYGDLRLGRINTIYRIRYAHTHFVRGYLYGYNRYVVFFQRKFSWILIVFVFFSLVLSAMQVGLSFPSSTATKLEENYSFIRASYVFVVFSMVSVVAVLAFVVIIFVWTFVYNMIMAITHSRSEQRRKRELHKQKEEAKKNGGE